MHLVVLAHPCFFWVVCHPCMTFSPQNSLKGNLRIGFPPSPSPDYILLPLTHGPPFLVLAGYRLVISRPCVCFIFAYVQNLPAAHAFVMVWRLVYIFCCPSLAFYGVRYFLISCSLWPTPFRGWALLDCGPFFLQPALLLLSAALLPFPAIPLCHSFCDVIWPKLAGPL